MILPDRLGHGYIALYLLAVIVQKKSQAFNHMLVTHLLRKSRAGV